MQILSKKTFCKALDYIKEQDDINDKFSSALEMVGDGPFVYGADNKFYSALLLVLQEAMHDKYDYISWWLYDTDDYVVYSADDKKSWDLKEPTALYDYLVESYHEERKIAEFETDNKMQWFVVRENINTHSFEKFDIFNHGGFCDKLADIMKKNPSREEFTTELDYLVKKYFWNKCEWEIVISGWPPQNENPHEKKVDVYQQLRLNWELFVEYVWQFMPTKKKEEVSDEL